MTTLLIGMKALTVVDHFNLSDGSSLRYFILIGRGMALRSIMQRRRLELHGSGSSWFTLQQRSSSNSTREYRVGTATAPTLIGKAIPKKALLIATSLRI